MDDRPQGAHAQLCVAGTVVRPYQACNTCTVPSLQACNTCLGLQEDVARTLRRHFQQIHRDHQRYEPHRASGADFLDFSRSLLAAYCISPYLQCAYPNMQTPVQYDREGFG
jgi:hypothetical protein